MCLIVQKWGLLDKMGVNQGIRSSKLKTCFTSFITHQNSHTKKVVVKSVNAVAKWYALMYTLTVPHTNTYMHAHTYIYTYTHIHIYIYRHMCIIMCNNMYVYVYLGVSTSYNVKKIHPYSLLKKIVALLNSNVNVILPYSKAPLCHGGTTGGLWVLFELATYNLITTTTHHLLLMQ